MLTNELLSTLLNAIKRIGDDLYKKSSGEKITYQIKNDNSDDVVTMFDYHVQERLVQTFRSIIPEANICAEEGTFPESASPYTFYIDPIDGTINFIRLGRDYTISVALHYCGQAYWGVIYDPATQTCYEAIKDKGAYCNGKRIRTAGANLQDVLWEGSYSSILHFEKRGMNIEKMHRLCGGHRYSGSVTLGMTHVAQGNTGFFITSKARAWDYASGALLIEEAGGVIYPLELHDLPYTRSATPMIVAANKKILDEVLSVITK